MSSKLKVEIGQYPAEGDGETVVFGRVLHMDEALRGKSKPLVEHKGFTVSSACFPDAMDEGLSVWGRDKVNDKDVFTKTFGTPAEAAEWIARATAAIEALNAETDDTPSNSITLNVVG